MRDPVDVKGGKLEEAQEELAEVVAKLKSKDYFVVCMGGGHDIAYGTYNGILSYAKTQSKILKLG